MPYILALLCYFVNTNTEYINNIALPTKNEYLPNFSDILLPNLKPISVNIILTTENVITDANILLYMYSRPIPTEKLSKLTLKAKKRIPNKFSFVNLCSSSKK